MAATGGFFPYDELNALGGPCRALIQPIDSDRPTEVTDIFDPSADGSGEYVLEGDWRDTGLSADAPSLSHDKDISGVDFQQVSNLFQKVTGIERQVTLQIAEFSLDNIRLVENTLAEIEEITAAAGRPAQKKLPVGMYTNLAEYQVALVLQYMGGEVTEVGGGTRHPFLIRYVPRAALAAEKSEVEFDQEDPSNAEVVLTALPASDTDAGEEHGYWLREDGDQIIGT